MHLTFRHWRYYGRLIRFEKPIGTYLLLWPALWALWLAQMGHPSVKNLIVFVLGTFIMRSAGCVINDYADRDFDGHIERTRSRPLAAGDITSREALEFFALLIVIAFILVLFTNALTIKLSLIGASLAALYPFMKRITHLPQMVLGIAFSYPIPMAWAAETSHIPSSAWWLMAGTFFWIMAYDTYYAMVDRNDDIKVGLKSTAILFGRYDKAFIAMFNLCSLICFLIVGIQLQLNGYYYLGLVVGAGLFIYQQYITRHRTRESCFVAFLNNSWVGAVIFLGVLASLT